MKIKEIKEFEKFESNEITFDEIYNIDLSKYSDQELSEYYKYCEKRQALLNTKQKVLKNALNSLYGSLANPYFILFNRDIASSITGNGRTFIRGLSQFFNKKFNEMLKINENFVIYNDTDSVYLTIKPFVEKIIKAKFNNISYQEMDYKTKNKFLDVLLKFIEKYLEPLIDEYVEFYANGFNSFDPSVIKAKLEKIADRGLHIAKKKYAVRAIYNEGERLIKYPKISVTGLEVVRSSTPPFCKKYLKDAIPLIMDKTEKDIQKFIKKVKEEFIKADIDDIARVSGVSNLNYQLINGKYKRFNEETNRYLTAPINSRAALLHNKLIDKFKLNNQFQKITEKDKIKYIFLKVPNIVDNNEVIGYLDKRFLEITNLINYIDYNTMFEKFFLSPLKIILDTLEYKITPENSSIGDWI